MIVMNGRTYDPPSNKPTVVFIAILLLVIAACLGCLLGTCQGADTPPTPPADDALLVNLDLSANDAQFSGGEPLAVTFSLANCSSSSIDAEVELTLEVGGESWWWPLWDQERRTVWVAVRGQEIRTAWPVVACLPAQVDPVSAEFRLSVWLDGSLVWTGVALFDLVDTAPPTPTPVPPTPTPAPTATPDPEPWCETGSVVFAVRDIPEMTGLNKDTLNKQVLACVVGDGCGVFLYHRYYQPSWPVGEWWPVWRLEVVDIAGTESVEWWGQCGDLLPGAAEFSIQWAPGLADGGPGVLASCAQAGVTSEELVELSAPVRLATVAEDGGCAITLPDGGLYQPWPSEAEIVPPVPAACGGEPASGPWVSGLAKWNVTGSTDRPSGDAEKGAIFALIGPAGEWAVVRHRSRLATPGGSDYLPGGWWQLKASANDESESEDCWREINYWQTDPADDGRWTATWGHDDNGSWIEVADPSGDVQFVQFGFDLAWIEPRAGECPECRGAGPFSGTAALADWRPMASGESEACE